MAGEWLKWCKGLSEKPEVYCMSAILRRTREDIATRLMKLWEWCDDNISDHDITADGHAVVALGGLHKYIIDSEAGLDGFAEAMRTAGWLRVEGNLLTFPNYARNNGRTAKERARNAANQQAARKQGRPVTEMSPANGDKSVTREEKRREEEKREEKKLEDQESCVARAAGAAASAGDEPTLAVSSSDDLPAELTDWLTWWNSLHARGLVSCRVDVDAPSQGALAGWGRVKRHAKLRRLLADRDAIEREITSSEFCRGSWFRLEKLFGGKNRDGELIVAKLLDGGFRDRNYVSRKVAEHEALKRHNAEIVEKARELEQAMRRPPERRLLEQ